MAASSRDYFLTTKKGEDEGRKIDWFDEKLNLGDDYDGWFLILQWFSNIKNGDVSSSFGKCAKQLFEGKK